MALISEIERVQKDRPSVHSTTTCTAAIFASGRESYLQLDTFGSAERQDKGKVSQTIQFNRESAIAMLSLLREAFPDLSE